MASCSKDCSTSISTPIHVVPSAFWDYAGLYVNLESKAVPMSITGLGMHCLLPEGKVGQLHVWEKTGNHYDDGAWWNSNKWNKIIDNQDVTCNGAGALTNIYFDEAVSIPAASRHALHVFVNTDDLDNDYPTMRGIRYNWCDGGGQQEPYTEDNYLVIRAGGGNRCKTMWCYMSSPIVSKSEYSVLCRLSIVFCYISNAIGLFKQQLIIGIVWQCLLCPWSFVRSSGGFHTIATSVRRRDHIRITKQEANSVSSCPTN